MIKKIALGFAAVVAVFLIVVAIQPAAYRVARTATLAAPPPVVFAQVNELKKWEGWSPWAKMDPTMKLTYSGPPSGQGATYHWVGNDSVGEGRLTITDSRPNDLILFDLEFIKPMADTCLTRFDFKPEGAGTTVTWTMTGTNNFIAKAVCLFMNMDKMVGGQFDQGLQSMKAIVEAGAKP